MSGRTRNNVNEHQCMRRLPPDDIATSTYHWSLRISYAPTHEISCSFPSCSYLGICPVNRETEAVLCSTAANSDIGRGLCQPSPPTHMLCLTSVTMQASLCRTTRGTVDGPTYRTPAVEMIANSRGHARSEPRSSELRGSRETSERTRIPEILLTVPTVYVLFNVGARTVGICTR